MTTVKYQVQVREGVPMNRAVNQIPISMRITPYNYRDQCFDIDVYTERAKDFETFIRNRPLIFDGFKLLPAAYSSSKA